MGTWGERSLFPGSPACTLPGMGRSPASGSEQPLANEIDGSISGIVYLVTSDRDRYFYRLPLYFRHFHLLRVTSPTPIMATWSSSATLFFRQFLATSVIVGIQAALARPKGSVVQSPICGWEALNGYFVHHFSLVHRRCPIGPRQ